MQTRRSRALAVLAAGGWCVALLILPAAAQPPRADDPLADRSLDKAPLFVERPGLTEFRGVLVVRPRPIEAWVRMGYTPGEAAEFHARAVAMMPNVTRHFPATGEYLVDAAAAYGATLAQRGAANPPARGEAENAVSRMLMDSGLFEYADPDWTCFPLATPNDPLYNNQWHLPKISAPAAWDFQTGSSNIIVGFVDTGIDVNHPDLSPLRVPGFNSVTNTPEVQGGQVNDINGHGTLVTGTGAARGNNNLGVAGVGWNLRPMHVRTSNLSSGNASQSDILNGARWAVENGAKSASCSYSGVDTNSVQTTGAYIKSIGGLLVYAAGNDARDLSNIDFADVIIVGASDQGDNRASFSAFGRGVDIFAPGVSIYATTNGSGYGAASGTSFSTPMVNGAIGVVWSVAPSFSPTAVQNFILTSATDLGAPGDDNVFGWGRLNLNAAVAQARATLAPANPTANPDFGTALWGAPVTLDVLADDSDPNPTDTLSILSFPGTTPGGGAVSRSVGTGPGGRDRLTYTPGGVFTGTDTFTYTLTDNTGRTANGSVSITVFNPATLRDPDPPLFSRQGVRTAFYRIPAGTSQLPDFDALTPYARNSTIQVNFGPTNGFVSNSGQTDNIAAIFSGWIVVPIADTYTFRLTSDEGSKLYVGNTLLIDNDGLHGPITRTGSIGLKPGRHRVRIEYFEATGSATCVVELGGSAPAEAGGLPMGVVPTSSWTLATCPIDFNNDDSIDLSDFFTYLNAFDAGQSLADINDDNTIDLSDFFEFLNLFDINCGIPQ